MKIATTFNNFTETVTSLNLFQWTGNVASLVNSLDIIDSIVLNLYCHPRIKTIKNKFRKITTFSFPQVTLLDVRKVIRDIRLDKFSRPVSTLPLLSKIYGRLIFDKLSWYFNKILSKFLYGLRKPHSTQTALFRLLHSWQKALENSGYFGTAHGSVCQKLMTVFSSWYTDN